MVKDGAAYENALLTDWSAPPPSFLLKGVLSVVSAMRSLMAKLIPPPATVLMQCSSFIPAAWLMQTARLGIADLLKDGPLTAAELAAKAGVREDDLYRALRMLAAHGFYEALPGTGGEPARFRNNAASATLRTDHPNSVKHLAMHWYQDVFRPFAPDAVDWRLAQVGGDELPCAYEHVHGMDYWQKAREDPGMEAVFSRAMAETDALGLEAQLTDFDWGRFSRVVDMGGANGSVLSGVLHRHPTMQGVLFDQPQVVERAGKIWAGQPALKAVLDRVTMVGGDFFKSETLPKLASGDVVHMRNILHDWSDEASVRILKALRAAIGSARVTLALCELALEPEFSLSPFHAMRLTLDVHMLSTLRGKERTAEQFQALFAASGFKLQRVHAMRCPQSMVEAVPV